MIFRMSLMHTTSHRVISGTKDTRGFKKRERNRTSGEVSRGSLSQSSLDFFSRPPQFRFASKATNVNQM